MFWKGLAGSVTGSVGLAAMTAAEMELRVRIAVGLLTCIAVTITIASGAMKFLKDLRGGRWGGNDRGKGSN